METVDARKALILGGGQIGRAAALELADSGYGVTVADNLSRLGTDSIVPVSPFEQWGSAWNARIDEGLQHPWAQHIDCTVLDAGRRRDYNQLCETISRLGPNDTIVHAAGQRSAPYSMWSPDAARETYVNNVLSTWRLINAHHECGSETPIVYLGSMCVSASEATESGILPAIDSNYTRTKAKASQMLAAHALEHNARVSILRQGIVYDTQTELTTSDSRLAGAFYYDGMYGTVVSHLIAQAVIGEPLTIHGTGAQKRGFISLEATVRGIMEAVAHPPDASWVVVDNAAQILPIHEAAQVVSELTGAEICQGTNPRSAAEANHVEFTPGSSPSTGAPLSAATLRRDWYLAWRNRDCIDPEKIPTHTWEPADVPTAAAA